MGASLIEFARDFELDFLTEAVGLKSLHHGLWRDGDPPTLAGLQRAQARYTDNLCAHIPPGVNTILDVGSGVGDNAHFLAERGYLVTAFSPTVSHRRFYYGTNHQLEFHTASLETFVTDRRFDLVLMSESVNYFSYETAFQRLATWLRPGGYLLVSGIFRGPNGDRFRQRHPREAFVAHARAGGYALLHDQDVTTDILPTLDLAREHLLILFRTLELVHRYRKDPRCPRLLQGGLFLAGVVFSQLPSVLSVVREMFDMMDRKAFEDCLSYRFMLFQRQA